MKGNLKKSIAIIITFAMIINMGLTVSAGSFPSSYGINKNVEVSTEGSDGVTTVTQEVYGAAVLEQVYEVHYLVEETGETVPGLETMTGSGSIGAVLEVPHPDADDYEVLANQPDKLVINEDAEKNIVVVFYGIEAEQGDNPDNISNPSTGIEEAKGFYYPAIPKAAQRSAMLVEGNGISWPNPGAINLTKEAAPVSGTTNKWQVTLTIEGKNIQKTSKVVLVIDKSGSMKDDNKMTNTISAAKQFVDQLLKADKATQIAVVSFDDEYHVISEFKDYDKMEELKTAIEGIRAEGATNIQSGIGQAQALLDSVTADAEYMVLLGDGEPTKSYLVTDASGISIAEDSYWNPTIIYDNPEITQIDYTKRVGNGSSYNLSSEYRYVIPCSNHSGGHVTAFPENNGVATKYEAGLAKTKGTKIYSIAFNSDNSGKDVLNTCQNAGYYEVNSSDLSVISGVFSEIAGEIAYAASEGSVEDPMGDMFNLISGATEIIVSQGTIESAAGNVIKWNVGNIAEGVPATMTYVVQIKPEADPDIKYPTNKATIFSYIDAFNTETSKNFEIPEVAIDGGSIIMKSYLVNYKGEPINEAGTVVEGPEYAAQLASTSFSTDPLAYNTEYTVPHPDHSGYVYVKYVFGSSSGADGQVKVTLQSVDPTQTVWFAYRNTIGYTVKYHVDGVEMTEWQEALSVPLSNPVVEAVPDKAPEEYGMDKSISTRLPATITDTENIINIYYIEKSAIRHTVTFAAGANGSLKAGDKTIFGEIKDGTAWASAVTVPGTVANTGYKFDKWTPALPETITDTVTYTASFVVDQEQKFDYKVYYYKKDSTTPVPGITPNPASGKGYLTEKITLNAPSISGYKAVTSSQEIAIKLTDNVAIFYYTKKSSGGGTGGGGSSNPKPSTNTNNNNTNTTTIVPEEIPLAFPELNKVDHYQYMQGYPDNTVRPEGNITREEVAAVFYRLLTSDYRGSIMTKEEKFSDVEAGKWSTVYIATLANGGILEGNPDGTFKPTAYITKAELAAVTSRFDNLSPFEADSFTDIKGHWANKYINSAAKKGWVKGNPNGTYEPNKYITRAEFATLVNNVLERRVHKANILADAKKFPDLLETKWYYESMMEAINSHYYNRLEDGYEEWTDIYYPELKL